MSTTCHTTSTTAESPSWQFTPASPTRTRRRWGGIFASDEAKQYSEVTFQPQPPIDLIAPFLGGQRSRDDGPDTSQSHVNANGEQVSRRSSLARSNAVCHRRSRAVSRFSDDSTDSLSEPADTRWSRASSSPDAPSTAATTPSGGSSPCTYDDHEHEHNSPAARGPLYHTDHMPERDISHHQFPRGFPGHQMFLSRKELPLFENSLMPQKTKKAVHHDHEHSLQERLQRSEKRAEALEKQNALLLARIHDPAGQNWVGSSQNIEQLVEKWVGTTQQPKNLNNENIVISERTQLIERVEELEKELRQKTEVIETFLTKVDASINDTSVNKNSTPSSFVDVGSFEKSLVRLKHANELLSCLDGSLTPRRIVLLKLVQQSCSKNAKDSQDLKRQDITEGLDAPLEPGQAIRFARSLEVRSSTRELSGVSIKTCSICGMPRFLNRSLPTYSVASRQSSALDTLNEFHPSFGTTSCCSKPICIACLPSAIISAITRDWWHNLSDEYWVRCPIPNCSATLSLRYNVDLTSLLGPPGDPGVLMHVRRFELAKLLRRALQGLRKQPTSDELERAAALHEQLIKLGFMRDVFDLNNQSGLGLDLLEVLPVDSADERKTLQVPLFKGLLNMNQKQKNSTKIERDCLICAESISDLVDGTPENEERWMKATAGFPGSWAWRVRAFPPPSLLPDCSKKHNLDICRACLARHLETSLDTVGRAGCDTLSCPLPDCDHVYTYNELKALASPKTFAKYDKYRLVTHLATLPNFRWCLREGCDSGQIYDPPAAGFGWQSSWDGLNSSSHIRCDVCRFEMCFKHQIPWHKGLTCEAYDNLKAHGDPAIQATKAWIERNTKTCPGPGCGVPVEKKGGCFHMTCQACKFEFCWECLANWKNILKNRAITGARRYDRKGHNVGCYFRGDGVPEPTMVVGNDIEEATRHM